MKMITGDCEICKSPITPAKTQTQFNRNLRLHRRVQHNLKGMNSRERYYVDTKGMTLEQARAHIADRDGTTAVAPPLRELNDTSWKGKETSVEEQRQLNRREYQRKYRLAHKRKATTNNNGSTDAVPIKLSECPFCSSRFYGVKGAQ